ncbi:Conserved_hypothetical protein [Hexamita inflata]|uniref:Microbial-type PARG catalytic domain-containing protein n=1 Tax=Hexamita inflata TaxID=28002 RepID=A0AA86QSD7_9EUKA|nr:Conserved hypothetical protein [Hexamita inflata]
MSHINNLVDLAEEAIKISKERQYLNVKLPEQEPPVVYTEKMIKDLIKHQKPVDTEISCEVIKSCTVNAAIQYSGQKVVILNFANGHHPGGGFTIGARAQEEQICRCSDLYSSLMRCMDDYYVYHSERQDIQDTERIIVSKNYIFKNTNFNLLEQPVEVIVVTCAAVTAYQEPNEKRVHLLMKNRISNIMAVVRSLNADVAILGAFGCGAFANDPNFVAQCFKEDVQKKICCKKNVFAVVSEGQNLAAFKKVFQGEK